MSELFKLRYGDSGHIQEYINKKPDYTQTSVNHIVYNKHTTKDQLNKLIDDVGEENLTPHKVIELSKHPNFDWDKHLKSDMFKGNEHRISVKNLTHNHIERLLEDPSNDSSFKIATQSQNLTDEHKDIITKNPDWLVRGLYAQNPTSKIEHLRILASDSSDFVKNHANKELMRRESNE